MPGPRSPHELYAMESERVSRLVRDVVGDDYRTNHLSELGYDGFEFPYDLESPRMEVRWIKDWWDDHRRFWRVGTVWLDQKPVMIIQNAGREGTDWFRRYITDPELFWELCAHINSLRPFRHDDLDGVVDPDCKIAELTKFYNHDLDEPFYRDGAW